jgi:putative inorganic carbon (hco3(-)) transporter
VGRQHAGPELSAFGPYLLGAISLFVTFTAPAHRIDLLAFGMIGLAVTLLWRPRLGPFFIGTTLPVYFFSRQLIGPLSVSPPGLVLLLSWPAALLRERRNRTWPRTRYDAPLALFLLASLLALAVSEYPLLSVRELRALILEPVLFFWLLAIMPGTSRLALAGFLTTAAVVAAAAIGQVVLGIGGTEAEGVRRAQAWYPSPNHLALMLGRAWPFLLAGGLARSRLLLIPAAVVAMGVLLTFSTGAWLATGCATVVTLAAMGWRRVASRLAAAGALVLVVVAGFAVAGALPERLNPLRQTGTIRLDLWISSLEMLKDHPLLGVGLDNFSYLYGQIYLRSGGSAEPNLSHPHNWLLHMWLELGLLGLVAFVWLLWRFGQGVRGQGPGVGGRASGDWVVAGALGAMTDMLVHGLFDNSYFLVDLAYLFWMMLALVDDHRSPTPGP